MISEQSLTLLFLPLTIGKVILAAPSIWDKQVGLVRKSTGLMKLNMIMCTIGNIVARLVILGFNLESISHGHVSLKEVIICSFLFPLYGMSIAFWLTGFIYWDESIYLANQVLIMNRKFGTFFNIPPNQPDGAERMLLTGQLVALAIAVTCVPSTAFFLQRFENLFYNIRFQTLAYNFIPASVAFFGLMGDLMNAVFWATAIILYMRMAMHCLRLMRATDSCTNESLASYIQIYRTIQLCHQLMEKFAKYLFPAVHICVGVMAITFLFNLIYLNQQLDLFFGMQCVICSFFIISCFEVISKAINDYIDASKDFLDSYKPYMGMMSPDNIRAIEACQPFTMKIHFLFSYNRLTFVQITQDIILAKVIDLILMVKELEG